MKTILSSAAITLGVSTLATVPVQADHHMEMSFYPSEVQLCSFNDGMGRKDLDKVTTAFNKWLKKTKAEYTYYLLGPMYHEDSSEFDYLWVGSWPNGAAMGADYNSWMEDDDGVQAMFAEVADCSQHMMTTTVVHTPDGDGPWERGVVWFQRCEMEDDDMRLSDAVTAHRTYSEAAAEMGEQSASWIMMPGLGMGDTEVDYWHVQAWPSFNELGEGFDNFFNKAGYKVANEAQQGLDCDSPNLYVFRLGGSGAS